MAMISPRKAYGPQGGIEQCEITAMPASVGGWNVRDSIAKMPAEDAVSLVNLFPTPTDVMLRQGSSKYATSALGQCNSLMIYRNGAVETMFVAIGTAFYDATAGGALGAAVVSGLTNNVPWQYVNMGTSATQYLFCCNGSDFIQRFDQAGGWKVANAAAAGGLAITGVAGDTSTIINIALLHNRLFLIKKSSNIVYFLGANAISGAVGTLDLGPLLTKGGYIVAAGGWSMDGGAGMQEYSVFLSSQGEAVVYQGYDPTNAALWSLVGVYQVGSPIGYHCLLKFAADLLILSGDGLSPASKAFITARTTQRINLSDKILQAINNATGAYGTLSGWQIVFWPALNMVLVNVPVPGGSQQFVMNTITKAWCLFQGWNAQCFDIFKGNLYFGDQTGNVWQAWTGTSDGGANIVANFQTSFQNLGRPGMAKEVVLLRPLISWDNNPVQILLEIDVDFITTTLPAAIMLLPPISGAGSGAIWDTSNWDQATWAGDPNMKRAWFTGPMVSGPGFYISPHYIISTNSSQLRFAAYDVVWRKAGTQV